MKRILFITPDYAHGGTNKSLENLLHFIDHKKYDVSIFCMYEYGSEYYRNKFQPHIIDKSLLYTLSHDNTITRKIIGAYKKFKKNYSWYWLYKYEANYLTRKYNFDTIIGFQEGMPSHLASCFQTGKKICWVHCNYADRITNKGFQSESYIYDNFDEIICVSETAKNAFIKVYPQYEKQTLAVYNTLNVDFIRKNASLYNPCEMDDSCFNIISVGRFSFVKQFELIPQIARAIQTKIKFKWYIVGDGAETFSQTKSRIHEYGLEDSVILLGSKDNPYPYMKKADLHICTSYSESFSYTIAESKILGVPVLCNDFPVAHEVINEDCGWICKINSMHSILKNIIENIDNIYTDKKEKVSKYSYRNSEIIQLLYQVL